MTIPHIIDAFRWLHFIVIKSPKNRHLLKPKWQILRYTWINFIENILYIIYYLIQFCLNIAVKLGSTLKLGL